MKRNTYLVVTGVLAACAFQVACVTERVEREVVTRETSHLDMCLMYANQNDYQNAIKECKVATEQQPSAAAYSNLGVAYLQVGKTNLALSAFKQAHALSPTDPYVNYNLATAYSLMDQTDLSLESLDAALGNGFDSYDSLRFDKDLDNVRGEPEFRKVLEKHHVFIQ